jgi:hypothetical protein
VTAAYLPVLLPVLELLQVSVQDAFEAVDAPRAEERRRVRATATRLLRPPRAERLSAKADTALDETIERARAVLRAEHPELFDRRGRPRKRAIARMIAEATQGQPYADAARYDGITDRAAERAARGPGA